MTKWELARYLIDAKKCVDSVLYIQENAEQLQYIDLRKKIEELRREFFIKCCTVIDEHIKTANIKKRDLCVEDPIVDRIYYERDKNSAHKDSNYKAREYGSIAEICDEMSRQCKHVREVCIDSLPKNLTLDFVPHDRSLFRIIHRLTKVEEDEILQRKHPLIDRVNFLATDVYERLVKFCAESGQPKTVAVERAINMYIDDYDAKMKRLEEEKKL